ncbi:MAG: urocanate hydratase [Promethearchaeota archaeon]|nr:urocanate hydratase [Candidatus Lokiarchaeota archaeon]TET61456.1 MAG: urocanate hydratase [Candidatus Lokiarchaeota archaeon]
MDISKAMKIKLPEELPVYPKFVEGIRRAPSRSYTLNPNQTKLSLKNALRYIPHSLHEKLAPEFIEELVTRGRIYGYRYRPEGNIKAKPVDEYRGNTLEGKALQVMIDNNLDFDVALYPYELTTYGESGQVFQNWMQYRLVKMYLEKITDKQTLVIASGHPVGLFPTSPMAPRVISTNGLMVGMFDNPDDFSVAAALGVANYGQMTAGGWMYIGPQGIVHGTYITLLNAGRLYLNLPQDKDLSGILYLTSGLGGMSGAQAKAIEIAGGIGVIAEVDESRIKTRYDQGWISRISEDLGEIFEWVDDARKSERVLSIAYHGNVVNLWKYVVDNNIKVELASDQTSCHAVYEGGYTPFQISFKEGRDLIKNNINRFKQLVDESLKEQFKLIKIMTERGTYFWDYGNSFMKAVFDAGAKNIAKNGNDTSEGFVFPSYVEDIMGPICFDYGYGPFRWVCLSGKEEDLNITDQTAMNSINPERRAQDRDNYNWIRDAKKNRLVIGTKARILYADAKERINIALKFNESVRKGEIGPIMLGRDHHDVSGTDSPFRETSNIRDGSNVMAEMAVHCFAGNAVRGMTYIVLSNGGGVGIGKCFNGGFGLVLDGSEKVDNIIKSAIEWDVMGGIARRSWARNPNALETAYDWNIENEERGHLTLPFIAEDKLLDNIVEHYLKNLK